MTPPTIFFSSLGSGWNDLGGAAATTARAAWASGSPFPVAMRKFDAPLVVEAVDQSFGNGVMKAPLR